jgi:hypothetical protein
MTYSIYDEITGMSEFTKEQVKDKLAELHLLHIFAYPLQNHWEDDWFKPIVIFAAYAYSWESKMIRIGADWLKTKVSIAQRVALPEVAYEDVVHLKDSNMADCFMNFLHLYRDNMDYVHLTSIKDFYQQIMMNTTKLRVVDGTEGKTANLEDKFKDLRKGRELFDEIQEMEKELLDKYKILNVPKGDFKESLKERGNPLQVENSKYIIGK